jgi:hypothetical protein
MTTAGMPEAKVKVQVVAIQDVIKTYAEVSRKNLAAKGDLQDARKGIQDMFQSTAGSIRRLTPYLCCRYP